MILDLYLLRVFHASSYCSFMFNIMAICGHFKFICPSAVPIIPVMLILLFLIGVVQLAHQHEGAWRTHRSTINWIFTVFSLIIDYWIDNRTRVGTLIVATIKVASRTYRSTINWIFTMFSLIWDYWIDNGIYSAFITIIINLIIDKSRLCYKITIKYWQNVPYSHLY